MPVADLSFARGAPTGLAASPPLVWEVGWIARTRQHCHLQAGVTRTMALQQMFDYSMLLEWLDASKCNMSSTCDNPSTDPRPPRRRAVTHWARQVDQGEAADEVAHIEFGIPVPRRPVGDPRHSLMKKRSAWSGTEDEQYVRCGTTWAFQIRTVTLKSSTIANYGNGRPLPDGDMDAR
ncbi:hypothetical protein CERZMDRAFT_85687 [Cercospora zeae-maydis SCOH1-5]|uniref:Uncharacterized protein n=1 Tax=Cercospora zeae-maydis SCOH1-5 TaxID=717836 RepID=A0A6A6FCC3_9PEZI|nr:hypothetical protein CERZMDRAFT_85687 [Cercospora zeae-maydis SCOH1-5]